MMLHDEVNGRGLYGHRYFGLFFRSAVKIGEDGLTVGRRSYAWRDVEKFDFSYSGFMPPVGLPKSRITFSDGRSLQIDVSRFCMRGRPRRVGFVSGVTEDFRKCARVVERMSGKGSCIQWGI